MRKFQAAAGSKESATRRPGVFERLLVRSPWKSAISLLVGLGLWELIGRTVLAGSIFFVPFSTTVDYIYHGFADGFLAVDLRVSVIELVLGYLAAVVIGVVVGALMGLSSRVRDALGFWVDAFNSTPVLALAPLFILMLGIGIVSKIVFVAFVAVWTILLNTMTGFRHADRNMIDLVRSFGGGYWRQLTQVRIPLAIPSVATGLRIGVGRGVAGVVVGELFGSSAGLGYELFAAKDQFDTAGIFAAVVLLAAVALIAVGIMTFIERRLSRWR